MYVFLVHYLKWLYFGKFLLLSAVARNNRKWHHLHRDSLLVLKGPSSDHAITQLSRTVGFSEQTQYVDICEKPLMLCGQDRIDGSVSMVALMRLWEKHYINI